MKPFTRAKQRTVEQRVVVSRTSSRERDGESGPDHSRTEPSTNNRDDSGDSGGCSTSSVLNLVVNVPVVDGVRISVSRHNDSKVHKTSTLAKSCV